MDKKVSVIHTIEQQTMTKSEGERHAEKEDKRNVLTTIQ